MKRSIGFLFLFFALPLIAADITNVQLIAWDNGRARTLCDKIVQFNAVLTAYQSDYTSQGVGAAIIATGTAGSNIGDGYAVDGRQPITGTQIQNLIAAV